MVSRDDRAGKSLSRHTLRETIRWLSQGLLEREDQARALLLALLSGEHMLLIGPPGTAKSALARRLHGLVGGRWFERLLTRFTVPEELFGPLSLEALDHGRYEREIDGYLPAADVAFLDEVFKANSAILNALLAILNERVFDQGAKRIPVPLACLVAASNELPDDEAMLAFQDRFLFRCDVLPVTDASFQALLVQSHQPVGEPPWRLDPADVRATDIGAADIGLGGVVIEAFVALRESLRETGLTISDRRWVRAARVLRAAAWLDDAPEVGLEHLAVLRWLLPATTAQVKGFEAWLLAWLGADQALDPIWLEQTADAFSQQLEVEQSAGELAFDDSGKLAMARRLAGADSTALSDGAPRLSAFSRARRYSPAHIAARVAQISEVIDRVDHWLADATAHAERLQARLSQSLWIEPSLVMRALETFAQSVEAVRRARERLVAARAGFEALPLAESDEGRRPDPVAVPDMP